MEEPAYTKCTYYYSTTAMYFYFHIDRHLCKLMYHYDTLEIQ